MQTTGFSKFQIWDSLSPLKQNNGFCTKELQI